MKVLLVSGRSDASGGPVHVRDLATELKRQGFRIFIAAPGDGALAPDFARLAEKRFALSPRSFSPWHLMGLVHFIKSNEIDIIHSHGRAAGLYSRPCGRWTKRPVVHTFHGLHSSPGLMNTLKIAIDRVLAPWTSALIYVSKEEQHEGLRYHIPESVPAHVVLNGINLEKFPFADGEWTPHQPIRVGTIARQDPVKGLDLLKATALTLPDLIEWNLAGVEAVEGLEYRARCLGRADIPAFLRTIDILASFSRREGLPLSLLEALAVGTPLLLSKIDGHQYFFDHDIAIPFEAEHPQSFLDGLQKIATNIPATRERVARGQALVVETHGLPRMAEAVATIYRDIANQLPLAACSNPKGSHHEL